MAVDSYARNLAAAALNGSASVEALEEETRLRVEGDQNLQEQVDAIVAGSDVRDVVGTYAELQNYDTSKLGDNDIIKVLDDETRNNTRTYYRWNIKSKSFVYIGSEGATYTKAEIDSKLEYKQNVMQYEIMPQASQDYIGEVVQYVGETETYTQGHFYVCTTDGEENYQWVEIPFGGENVEYISAFEVINFTSTSGIIDSKSKPLSFDRQQLRDYFTRLIKKMKQEDLDSLGFCFSESIWGTIYIGTIRSPKGSKELRVELKMILPDRIVYNININDSVYTSQALTLKLDDNEVVTSISTSGSGSSQYNAGLKLNNTVAYTPTGDYNPTTKKYVDDADKILSDKISELELFKFPNVTIVGEPTIQQGQISDFTMENYLEFPFLVDFRNRPFEINFAFTTGTNVDTQQNILDSEFGLAFAIRNEHLVLALSTNGSSWATEQIGTLTLQPQTTYRIKISWNRLLYKVQYSIDGGNTYIDDITFGQTQQPYPKQMFIGVGKLADNYFEGIVNLNYADLRIDGTIVWLGMDDVGISSRLATDLSNIDSAGEQKIKDIAGGESKEIINTFEVFDFGFASLVDDLGIPQSFDREELYNYFTKLYKKMKDENITSLPFGFIENKYGTRFTGTLKPIDDTTTTKTITLQSIFPQRIMRNMNVNDRIYYAIDINLTILNQVVTSIQYRGASTYTNFFLKTDNTATFTPTGDYNPATKKYVDDTVANAIGDIDTLLQDIDTGGGIE